MTNTQAMNAVPKHFWIMLMSVIVVGSLAGNWVAPVFLLTTPLLAIVLFRAQVREAREHLFNVEHGLDRLPAEVRERATRALNALPESEVREQLVGILQAGGNALSNLPASYATSDYGKTIAELIIAALSAIGPDIAEAGDAGTKRILEILDALKREVSEHENAETEIEQLLN